MTVAAFANRFAVVACSGCGQPWAVELRNAAATCPRCQAKNGLEGRKKLWQGDDARDAQGAAAAIAQAGRIRPALERLPRHDSPIDAAAAKGRALVNKSARAEMVALWLERLAGPMEHRHLIDAMVRAGLDQDRAEAEVTRMLAMDLLMEPRSGHYRLVER